MRIVLLGFMGSGKSTVGKLLAQSLSLEFIDLDAFIEQQAGKKIKEIFEQDGETAFREKEKQALRLLLKKNNVVIAAGGGTPCFSDNMKRISSSAISVYLETDAEKLYGRLSDPENRKQRPLLKNAGKKLLDFIRKSLGEREKFYLHARMVVRTGEKSPEEIVKEIMSVLNNKN